MKQQESTFRKIPVARVFPNPEQPRKVFDEQDLLELADSIVEHGVIKPIAVEEVGNGDYVLHDGERRIRASKIAGLQMIPAMVHPPLNGTGPQERLTRALVANIQTASMSPVDEAIATLRLRVEFHLTNREISKRVSKAESWISRQMMLAELDPEILNLMRNKKISTESKVVVALKTLPADQRVEFANALAERKISAESIVKACKQFIALQVATKKSTGKSSPRVTMAMGHLDEIASSSLPEWDALYQLGRVPQWQLINDTAMRTCDDCSLRKIASDAICGECALVTLLHGLMEAVHA